MKVKVITKDKEIKIIDLKGTYGNYIVEGHRMGFDTDTILVVNRYTPNEKEKFQKERYGVIEELYYEVIMRFDNPCGEDIYETYYIDYDDASNEEEAMEKAKELFVEKYISARVQKDFWK